MGSFQAEEIHPFSEEDLCSEHAFILDVGWGGYVWEGASCSRSLASAAARVAERYFAAHPARPKGLPVSAFRVREVSFLSCLLPSPAGLKKE